MASNRKRPTFELDKKQETFLKKLLKTDVELTDRQMWVINNALKTKKYHQNHQYHLNVVCEKYKSSVK